MGYIDPKVHIPAARMAADDPALDALAARVKAAVLAQAAPHTKTGDYARSIRTRSVKGAHGVRDRIVETTDPNALSIEYGHQWVTPEGKIIGRIKGLYIFRNAWRKLRGGG